MKFLLDTNICVFVIRGRSATLIDRLRSFAVDDLVISTVTLAELRYGADKSLDPRKNHFALDQFLAPIGIAEFDSICADFYGVVRSDLERRGQPIGPLDTMIAAHGLRLRIPLVTHNTREFSRVTGLSVLDWASG